MTCVDKRLDSAILKSIRSEANLRGRVEVPTGGEACNGMPSP